MDLTYYGHSCFSVTLNNKKLLFDPFITDNELAKSIDIDSIAADYILLSHGHTDHVNDVEYIAKRTGATIIAGYEVASWFAAKGLDKNHALNTGGKLTLDFGTVKCVTAVHSSRMPDGSYGGNPVGFVITGEKNFYYAGDTALTMDMQMIPLFTPIDFAVLPIGDYFTMGMEDAALAAKWVQTKIVIGVHYDTFGLIEIDHGKAVDIFKTNGLELKLPAIGETIKL